MTQKTTHSTTHATTTSLATIPYLHPALERTRPTAVSPTPTPTPPLHWLRFVMGTLLLTLTASMIGAIVGLSIYFYHSDRLWLGTHISGTNIGGKTTVEAQTLLQEQWAQQTITIHADESVWVMPATTLGLSLDAKASVDQAYSLGRTTTSWQHIWQQNGRIASPAVWQVDTTHTEAWLHSISDQLIVPPVDTQIIIRDGQAQIVPAQPGRTLNVEATLNQLRQTPEQVAQSGELLLMWSPLLPQESDVALVVDQVNQLLAHTLYINAYDPVDNETLRWEIAPQQWGAWLTIQTSPAYALSWTINQEQLATHFEAQAAQLGPLRYLDQETVKTAVVQAITNQSYQAQLRIRHHAQTHTVQAGETLGSIGRNYGIPYPWLQQANPAVGDLLAIGQTVIIPSPDDLIPLPIVQNKRIVVSIAQQYVWVYENEQLKWEWTASTGIASSPTSPGIFQIQSHEANAYAGNWDLWMPSFLGIYRPVPTSDFMNGFHGFPTRNNTTLLWTGDLGHPVTYGCVLLSSENAQTLFDWAEEGVIVEIQA